MSAAVVISTGAAAHSAAAAVAANNAKSLACKGFVRGFEHDKASTQEMKQYAECIGRIHPDPIEGGDLLMWKAVVAAIFVFTILGLLKGYLDGSRVARLEDTLLGGFVGCVVGVVSVVVLWLVGQGIKVLLA